ncbi:hypothetical protein [Microbacterium sp. NPDC058389]|uniref:hypothetical protein n=1 Tax=Microbacterium sp. NPDC058389 TaxID=3346475 RepID=UPI003663C1CD
MDEPGVDPDLDAELRELRRRAYGPHPDIQNDARALARLIELETAHRQTDMVVAPHEAPTQDSAMDDVSPSDAMPSAPDVSATPTSRQAAPEARALRGSTRRSGLIALAAGAFVASAGVLVAVVGPPGPPADTVLQPNGAEPDDRLLTLLRGEGGTSTIDTRTASEMEIDLSTLRGFGTYQEVEVWSGVNAYGSPCLIGIHRPTDDVVARRCVPAEADLFMDVPWDIQHGESMRRALPEGQVLRFSLRADVVEVHVLESEGAG